MLLTGLALSSSRSLLEPRGAGSALTWGGFWALLTELKPHRVEPSLPWQLVPGVSLLIGGFLATGQLMEGLSPHKK